jgi:hypothetical protein
VSLPQSVLMLVGAWCACALLSSHAFLVMLRDSEARTGKRVSTTQVAVLIALWPLTWLAVGINCLYAANTNDGRGEDE